MLLEEPHPREDVHIPQRRHWDNDENRHWLLQSDLAAKLPQNLVVQSTTKPAVSISIES